MIPIDADTEQGLIGIQHRFVPTPTPLPGCWELPNPAECITDPEQCLSTYRCVKY